MDRIIKYYLDELRLQRVSILILYESICLQPARFKPRCQVTQEPATLIIRCIKGSSVQETNTPY
jgi:hypothetical protein